MACRVLTINQKHFEIRLFRQSPIKIEKSFGDTALTVKFNIYKDNKHTVKFNIYKDNKHTVKFSTYKRINIIR